MGESGGVLEAQHCRGLGVRGRVQGPEEAQFRWTVGLKGMALGQREMASPLKAGKDPPVKTGSDPEAHCVGLELPPESPPGSCSCFRARHQPDGEAWAGVWSLGF